MNNYIELTIKCSDGEMADVVTAFLADYPFETFDTEEQGDATLLRAYILEEAWGTCRDEALQTVADYGEVVSQKSIESQNWNAAWESESFKPV